MSRWLAGIGLLLSGVYLSFAFWLVGDRLGMLRTMELNSVGDFFAGIFGPLAILWLVLGFFQQGVELRQGTEALMLQATELKNSVEQQSIMAAAATQQIETQREALDAQNQERDRLLNPVFSFDTGSRMGARTGRIQTSSQITNMGAEVRNVVVSFVPPIGEVGEIKVSKMGRGAQHGISYLFQCPDERVAGDCVVTCLKSDGKTFEEKFVYVINPDNAFVFIERLFPSQS